jgi:hypothetical protein
MARGPSLIHAVNQLVKEKHSLTEKERSLIGRLNCRFSKGRDHLEPEFFKTELLRVLRSARYVRTAMPAGAA